MACQHLDRPSFTWRNRRTDIVAGQTFMVLNVPNGAGPGTIRFGSEDCFCVWRVSTNRNLVQLTQTTKTGRGNYYDLWSEDGAIALCEVAAFSNSHFSDLGVDDNSTPIPAIWCEWYPGDGAVPGLETYSIESGPTAPPWDQLTLGAASTTQEFTAQGLTRYCSVVSQSDITIRGFQITQAFGQSTPINIATAATEQFVAVGPWSSITLRSVVGGDYSIVWSRFPTGG